MVPQEILDQIIEAGLYAANGMGHQNTIIVQVTSKKVKDEISKMNCEIGGWKEGFDPFYGAPAMLIVLEYRRQRQMCIRDSWGLEAAGYIERKKNLKQNGEKPF